MRSGLTGGAFKPLGEGDITRIHRTALDILANVGVADPLPEMLELALAKGCRLRDDGRLCFPRAFVEDIIAGACREMTIYGRDPAFDIHLRGTEVSYSTAGQAVSVYENASRSYRASTLLDLYDLARLVDRLAYANPATRRIFNGLDRTFPGAGTRSWVTGFAPHAPWSTVAVLSGR